MAENIKDVLLAVYRQLLRPLVRILLRHGISYGEFSESAKTVFVEVANRDFRLKGRKQTISRIAILTGMTRKEVGRISELLQRQESPSTNSVNRVGRVLAAWHQDPSFTGPYGMPRELEFDDEEHSFAELVKRYSGDMPARAMLEELKNVGAVEVSSEKQVRALTRSYIPEQSDPASIQFMGVALTDLAETLDYNLNKDIEGGLFERRVWTPSGIQGSDMAEFDLLVTEKGQEFLELLDNWLTAREAEAEEAPENKKIKVGVGVFLFSDAGRSFRADE